MTVKLSRDYTYHGHAFAYIESPITLYANMATTISLRESSGGGGDLLAIIDPNEEIRQFRQQCRRMLGCSVCDIDSDDKLYINLKKFPPIFESNLVDVKELKRDELPWDGNVRITLEAVRVVFHDSPGDPPGDRIKTIKYNLTQIAIAPPIFKDGVYIQGENDQ